MTRGAWTLAALVSLALAALWLLRDDDVERRAPRALEPPRARDMRGGLPEIARTMPDAPRAEPTPLAPDTADAAPEPDEPPLVGDPFALRVTDDAGRPLPGLPLRIDARAQDTLPEPVIRFAQTDARGRAEFGPLPRGLRLLWSCRDPAWFLERWLPAGEPRPVGDLDAPGLHAGEVSTNDGPVVEFVARRMGVSLRGTLVDVLGEPLTDLRVRVYERAEPTSAEPRRAWRQSGNTRTGVDGRFVFTLLAPGEQRVVAVEREAEHRVRVHHAVAWLAPNASQDLGVLPRDPLASVQLVRVQATLDGRPVAPAEVSAKPDELRFAVQLTDDGDAPPVQLGELPADGVDVQVRGLPRARWRPQLGAQLERASLRASAAPPRTLPSFEPRVLPGPPLALEIAFTRPVELELHLRDETFGTPPRELVLNFVDDGGRTLLETKVDTPPPGAALELPLAPGPVTLVVHDARAAGPHAGERYGVLAVHAFEARAPSPQRVDVTLHASPEVHGTLRDTAGDPLGGVPLMFRLPGEGGPSERDVILSVGGTDQLGAFRTRGLPADTEVELVLPYGGAANTHRFRTAGPGATQQLDPITFAELQPGDLDRAWRAR